MKRAVTKLERRDRIHAELLALQGMVGSDIAFYKLQQWKVCNYALVLDAALAGVIKLIGNPGEIERLVFSAIALVIMVAGVYLIRDFGKSLVKSRDRLPALRKHFDRRVSLKAYAAGGAPDIALIGAREKLGLEMFFYFVLVLSSVITAWVIFRIG